MEDTILRIRLVGSFFPREVFQRLEKSSQNTIVEVSLIVESWTHSLTHPFSIIAQAWSEDGVK